MALGKVMGAVLCCVVLGAHAAAARLGPTKPSQVVAVILGGAGDPCAAGSGRGFLSQLNPDNTLVPFQIPPGQVLVVTEVTVSLIDDSVTSASNRIFRVGYPSAPGPLNPVALFAVPLDAAGTGAAAQEFSPGLVFKAGQTVCLDAVGGVLHATLTGYLNKDR